MIAAAAREAFGAALPIVLLAPDEHGPRLAAELAAAAWVPKPASAGSLRAAVRAAVGIG